MMKAQTMRQVRQLHLYLGIFFTPAILLFSVSGGLQTYRLQEAKGYGGPPPSWIVWIASVHKDQRLPRAEAEAAPKPAAATGAPTPAKPKSPQSSGTALLKIFVALLAAGLCFSALLGSVIALNMRSTRNVSILMLALGAIVPVMTLYL